MDDHLVYRGGCAGALIAFLVTISTVLLLFLTNSNGPTRMNVGEVIASSVCFAMIPATLGFFAGKEGARSKTVPFAFIKGGIFFGCAMGVFVVAFFLGAAAGQQWYVLLVGVVFSCLIIAFRDYREFGRTRLIPQFTLQELMIVTTLFGIIISTISTMVVLRR